MAVLDSHVHGRGMTLSGRYALASFLVLVGGALAIGVWVTNKIQEGVLNNTAAATAIYMDSFIAPLAQELAYQDNLTPRNAATLDQLLHGSELGKRVISMKLWKEGGLIAYSSRPEIIGKRFPATENLQIAWEGTVTAEFDSLHDEEDARERAAGIPLLEMYAPIREANTGRIIAVAEFYEVGTSLKTELFDARLTSWMVVTGITVAMYALLFGIVHGGSRTIQMQQGLLRERVAELSRLQDRLKRASSRSAEINEKLLRRIGAELHDGPAQLIGLALLRLDSIKPLLARQTPEDASDPETFSIVENMLTSSLSEIRQISAGLTLPELDQLSVPELLSKAVDSHRYRTGMEVELLAEDLPEATSKSVRICLYRLVQEALNNAYRHSGTNKATASARMDGSQIVVEVSDQGSGFERVRTDNFERGLGLPGLRERIESIGGTFLVSSKKNKGTSVMAQLPIRDEEMT